MKLNGLSTSNIQLLKNGDRFLVRKIYSEKRLSLQIEKQTKFYKLIGSENVLNILFSIPEIIEQTDTHLDMEYCNGNNILDLIEHGKKSDLDNIVKYLIMFLDKEFSLTNYEKISKKLVQNKLDSIDFFPEIKNKILGMINEEYFNLPVGICHGDFTFSNMIFSDKIILIDFLDNFIESPIQDITKIYQDLNLCWTGFMSKTKRDTTKINIGYQYLKNIFQEIVENNLIDWKINKKLINIFYAITLLRLFPYIKDDYIFSVVSKELKAVVQI